MSAATAGKLISIEDYLIAEEASLEKHEYYKGEVFAMAGASMAHNSIVGNSLIEIDGFLRDKSCVIFPGDLRIYAKANTFFTYPDVTIFCDPIERYNNRSDSATNPTVIIEVLSKSTKEYDRGTKFNLYRGLISLKEYILISSTEILAEKFTKQENNKWLFTAYDKPDDSFLIESIGLSVEVNSLYRNVSFEE